MLITMAIRVVLADDHELVRTCIRTLLVSRGIDVIAEAGDGRSLLHDVREHQPDVALVDVSMPLLDGIEATRRIGKLSSETRVVILTMHPDAHLAHRARDAGAWGYVVKDETPDRLVEVIERVMAGEQCIPSDGSEDSDALTAREREVLQLIAEGRRNREIAAIMSRSIHTVRSHRARLMGKLGARNATELVKAAEERGLLRWPV
jgi:DNA-binding NarL/FixJ family response regulator